MRRLFNLCPPGNAEVARTCADIDHNFRHQSSPSPSASLSHAPIFSTQHRTFARKLGSTPAGWRARTAPAGRIGFTKYVSPTFGLNLGSPRTTAASRRSLPISCSTPRLTCFPTALSRRFASPQFRASQHTIAERPRSKLLYTSTLRHAFRRPNFTSTDLAP